MHVLNVAFMSPRASSPAWHQPVMVEEVLDLLRPRAGAVIVDATVGTGGHGLAILPRLLQIGRASCRERV